MEQEHEADDRDNHRLLNERVLQGGDGSKDQVGSVVGWDQLHAVRQPQRGDLTLDRLDHLERVRADAHHDDAADRLAGPVEVGRASPDLGTVADGRHVTETDGCAASAHRDNTLLQVLEVLHIPTPTEHVLASGELEDACADFRVRIAHRAREIGQREPKADEPIRIDDDLVLSLEASQRGDLRNADDGLQRRPDGEVLQRAEFR